MSAFKRAVRHMLPGLLGGLMLLGGLAHAGTVTYVYTDPQGTPLAEADASGTITATFDYAPYGSQAMGTPPDGPGYTGHVNDPDTGLVYMQARYYDPGVGRFLSVDPVGPSAGDVFNFNRYAYANNNPVNRIDPDGRADVNNRTRAVAGSLAEKEAGIAAFVSLGSGFSASGGGGNSNSPSSAKSATATSSNGSQIQTGNASSSGSGGYKIHYNLPPGSLRFLSPDGTAFYGPANTNFGLIWLAGEIAKNNGEANIKAVIGHALGQGGTFDLQRSGANFYVKYTNAANFAVGVYMNGAGHSWLATLSAGTYYSMRHSSNGASAIQRYWWRQGWVAAETGNLPLGSSVP